VIVISNSMNEYIHVSVILYRSVYKTIIYTLKCNCYIIFLLLTLKPLIFGCFLTLR